LREIANIIEGVKEKNQREWEIARWVNLHVVAPHSKKRLNLKDIAVFDWERKQFEKPDEKKVLELSKKWDRWKRRS
jgi:hypothetical protein